MGAQVHSLNIWTYSGVPTEAESTSFYGVAFDNDYRLGLDRARANIGHNVGALVTTSAPQGVTTATDPLIVSWAGVVYDPDGWHDANSPTILTCPHLSITHVRLDGNMRLNGSNATQCYFRKNGANVYPLALETENLTGNKFFSISQPMIACTSGDYFEFLVGFVGATNTLEMVVQTWFSVTPVRYA